MAFELNLSVYWSRNSKKEKRVNMSWIDDVDNKRKEKSRGNEILNAKAFRFFDSVFESVKRDVAMINKRRQTDISILRPEPELITVSKKRPYPTFSVQAHLDVQSESLKIEWSYQEEHDQKMSRREVRWHLSLDSGNALHVTSDGEEIEADNASERMLKPLYEKR